MSTRKKLLWWVGGAIIVVYCLFPIAWIVSVSLKAPSDLTNQSFLPSKVSWENYQLILTGAASDLFLPALRNSFGICLIATALWCLLPISSAYAIARLDFPGKKLTLGPALAVGIFPVSSIVTP